MIQIAKQNVFYLLGFSALIFTILLISGCTFEKNMLKPEVKVDTSNWSTYKNEQYGFEFKYPSNWTRNDGLVLQSFVFRLDLFTPDYKVLDRYMGGDFPQPINEQGAQFAIDIDSLKGLSPYTNERFLQEKRNDYRFEGINLANIEVGGQKALYHIETTNIKENAGIDVNFIHPKNNTLAFRIMLATSETDKEKNTLIFDTILSTFRFD